MDYRIQRNQSAPGRHGPYMDDADGSDSSGGRHPAEDLIIQKALRRAAGTAASTSNIHDLPVDAQARVLRIRRLIHCQQLLSHL